MMKHFVLFGLAHGLLFCSGCQKQSTEGAPASDTEKDDPESLSPTLTGNYVERGGQAAAPESQHSFERAQWSEKNDAQSVSLSLVKQRAQGQNQWGAVFAYTLPSSQERQLLRVDLFKPDTQTLWLCRHPQLDPEDPLSTQPADPSDTEGQGCFGGPWRELQATR